MQEDERPVPTERNLVVERYQSDPESDSRRLEGVDAGPAVELFFGSDGYEYWVAVPERYRHWLLLSLIKDSFAGGRPGSAFKECPEEKCIPYEFHAY